MSENWIKLIELLIPLVVYALCAFFKTGQGRREEVAHALHTALWRMYAGDIDERRAVELVLATGAVSTSKANKVIKEVGLRFDEKNKLAIYKDNIVPGVAVTVNTGGDFKIDATGALNSKAHKLNKWAKKKLHINIF